MREEEVAHQLPGPGCLECGVDSGYQLVPSSATVDYLGKNYCLKFQLCRPCAIQLASRNAGLRTAAAIHEYLKSVQPPSWTTRFWNWLWRTS